MPAIPRQHNSAAVLVACVLLISTGLSLCQHQHQHQHQHNVPKVSKAAKNRLPTPSASNLSEKWKGDIANLWNTYGPSVAFCLGDSASGVAEILSQSFPYPLPSGPASDLLCSDSAAIALHLCEPEEVLMYYQVGCASWRAKHSPLLLLVMLSELRAVSPAHG